MIVGWARASEARREGGRGAGVAAAYSVLGAVSTLCFLAVVAFGVTVIVNK